MKTAVLGPKVLFFPVGHINISHFLDVMLVFGVKIAYTGRSQSILRHFRMKIISKYHDYYDPVMRSGYDPHVVYKREGARDKPVRVHVPGRTLGEVRNNDTFLNKVLNTELFLSYRYFWDGNEGPTIAVMANRVAKTYSENVKGVMYHPENCTAHLIGFCGRFYVTYEVKIEYDKSYTLVTENDILYRLMKPKHKVGFILGEVPNMFSGDPDEVFRHLDCPVFLMHRDGSHGIKYIRNPILRDVGFPAIMDPYTAFQELTMYLGSVFAPGDPSMDNISDESMASAKGFDEWSFKKHPTKKRK